MKILVTFPEELGKTMKKTAERMGLKKSQLCRIATIEYLRSLRVFEKR